jgi:UDP-glucose 4-epimerase
MELKEKRIVITGGCGFIGSHLAEKLSENNEVTIVDNLVSGTLENIRDIKDEVTLVKKDIRDIDSSIFEGIDVVFHEAAQVFISTSIEDPPFDADVNIRGTLHILESCRKKDVPILVFASSSSVYGEPQSIPVTEDHPLNPVTPYGLSKKVCEEYLRLYYSLYGFKSVALRYFNVYGKNQNPSLPNAGVISLFVHHVLNHEQLTISGDGTFTRDFVHVDDVVKANVLAACSSISTVVNIGTGRETTINEIVRHLERVVHHPVDVEYTPERKGDITRSVADITASKKILGFNPEIDLQEGLARLVCEVSE